VIMCDCGVWIVSLLIISIVCLENWLLSGKVMDNNLLPCFLTDSVY